MSLRLRLTVAILALCLAGSGAHAQGRGLAGTPSELLVFRAGIDVVTVNVSVHDGSGRVVRNLGSSDFLLSDTGLGRPILDVFPTEAPLSIAVLLDVSGSMAVGHNIDRARHAVRSIIGALDSGRDEVALYVFDSELRELMPFTTQLSTFDAVSLEGVPYGRTSLYDAMADVAADVGVRSNRHRALIVVTDGVDTGSELTPEEVSGVANSIRVPVHLLTVEPRRPESRTPIVDPTSASLEDLARWTGGSLQQAGGEEDTREALSQLLPNLRYQYLLMFEPSPTEGWHPILIETTNRNHAVHARGGYVAGPVGRLQESTED